MPRLIPGLNLFRITLIKTWDQWTSTLFGVFRTGQFILEPGRERKLASGGEGGPVGLKRLTSWSGAQALLKKTSRVGAARPLDK